MNKGDIRDSVRYYEDEIANEIFQIEYMTNAHSDFQREQAIISAYENIRHLIFDADE